MKFDAHLPSRLIGPDFLQCANAEEVEALRENEVFLQDPIAIEDVLRIRQQPFVRAEARKDDAAGRQPVHLAIDRYRDMLEVLSKPQVERAGCFVITAQVEIQAVAAEGVQGALDQGAQFDACYRTVERLGSADRLDLERVDVHGRARTKYTRHAIHGPGEQR